MNYSFKYIFILFIIISFSSYCQNADFKEIIGNYEIERLNLNIVDNRITFRSVERDKDGYLWIASDNGMWVYDGTYSKAYKNGDLKYPFLKDSLSSHFTGLTKDKDGFFYATVWGTGKIIKYDPLHRKAVSELETNRKTLVEQSFFMTDSNNHLYYISYSKEKEGYVLRKSHSNSTKDLFILPKINGKDQIITDLGVTNNHIFLITELFIYCIDAKGKLVKRVDNSIGRRMYANSKGIYFINWSSSEIFKWNFSNNTIDSFLKLPIVPESPVTRFMVQDNLVVYVGLSGFYVVDLKRKTVQNIQKDIEDLNLVHYNDIPIGETLTFKEHIDGSFLLLTEKQLFKVKRKNNNLNYFEEHIEGLKNQPSMRALTEDSQGNIFASYYTGIAKKDNSVSNFKVLQIPKKPSIVKESSYSLDNYKGNLLWDNVYVDLKNNKLDSLSLGYFWSHTAQFRKQDSLWLFVWYKKGLINYDLSKRKMNTFEIDSKKYPEISFVMINSILESKDKKNLWLGSRYHGISLMSKTGEIKKNYSNQFLQTDWYVGANDLFFQNNLLWYAASDGLGVFNTETEDVAMYKFPTDYDKAIIDERQVFFILPHTDNEFYLGTDYGLILFNSQTRTYSELVSDHPLATLEFNRASRFKASNGVYYVGTTQGLYSFYPIDLNWNVDKESDRTIRLNQISIFNKEGEYNYINEGINKLDILELQSGDTDIDIHFSALKERKNIFYSYRVLGINDNWSSYFNEQKINLLGLPAGKFTLQLRTLNSPDSIKSLQIIKADYWYKHPLAFILLFLSTVLIVWLVMRYKFKLKLSRERELSNLRIKLSSDLHDDVGSILTGIAMQSEMLSINNPKIENKKLLDITEMSRLAMDSMRDIVWSLDASKDKVQNLLDRMRGFALKRFENSNFKHSFKINNIEENETIDQHIRQQVYLIFKEAITNILKHSNGNKVTIDLRKLNGNLILSVKDNGTTKTSIISDGQGCANMYRRASTLGGEVKFYTKDGFEVKISIPLS